MLSLARSLGLEVVAEGVGQLESLKELGCELPQRYYFSKPFPGDALITLLNGR